MEYISLHDFINCMQYGTKLHIGVLFFGDYGNEKCILPHAQQIHAGKICTELKLHNRGYKRCYACRCAAIHKAMHTKKAFSGLCINGIYEYTRPVVIDNNIACIIYIGNILEETKGLEKLRKNLIGKENLLNTLEKNFSFEMCETFGALIENHIRILLNYVPATSTPVFKPLIENIKSYIEANLEYNIKLSNLANAFGYNEQYIGRLFKKEMHMNFSEYVNMQRIRHAKILLKETTESVIIISMSVGFNNVTYFNKMFKKHTGITPLEYRNKSTN